MGDARGFESRPSALWRWDVARDADFSDCCARENTIRKIVIRKVLAFFELSVRFEFESVASPIFLKPNSDFEPCAPHHPKIRFENAIFFLNNYPPTS